MFSNWKLLQLLFHFFLFLLISRQFPTLLSDSSLYFVFFFLRISDCRSWFSKYNRIIQALLPGLYLFIVTPFQMDKFLPLTPVVLSFTTESNCKWYQGMCVSSSRYSIWWFVFVSVSCFACPVMPLFTFSSYYIYACCVCYVHNHRNFLQ